MSDKLTPTEKEAERFLRSLDWTTGRTLAQYVREAGIELKIYRQCVRMDERAFQHVARMEAHYTYEQVIVGIRTVDRCVAAWRPDLYAPWRASLISVGPGAIFHWLGEGGGGMDPALKLIANEYTGGKKRKGHGPAPELISRPDDWEIAREMGNALVGLVMRWTERLKVDRNQMSEWMRIHPRTAERWMNAEGKIHQLKIAAPFLCLGGYLIETNMDLCAEFEGEVIQFHRQWCDECLSPRPFPGESRYAPREYPTIAPREKGASLPESTELPSP
jgi:hypothetical protein